MDDWKKGKLIGGELSVLIHEYDKGPSKWMMDFYNDSYPEETIARAIAIGLLERDEVPDEILEMIEDDIALYQRREQRRKKK